MGSILGKGKRMAQDPDLDASGKGSSLLKSYRTCRIGEFLLEEEKGRGAINDMNEKEDLHHCDGGRTESPAQPWLLSPCAQKKGDRVLKELPLCGKERTRRTLHFTRKRKNRKGITFHEKYGGGGGWRVIANCAGREQKHLPQLGNCSFGEEKKKTEGKVTTSGVRKGKG